MLKKNRNLTKLELRIDIQKVFLVIFFVLGCLFLVLSFCFFGEKNPTKGYFLQFRGFSLLFPQKPSLSDPSFLLFAFSSVKNWSKFFCFFVFFVFENLVLPAERRGFKKINKNKRPISSVKNWSNFVAQHTWTSF